MRESSDIEPAALLARLTAARKQCHLCAGLTNPADVDGGALDSDRIGPYSRWQGNPMASLVVVAQDFADVESFRQCGGWPGERIATNLTLVGLLAEAGIAIPPPKRGHSDDTVFFTNAVLCLKQGRRQTRVPQAYFRNCGERFLPPTIEAIRPRAVATLGVGAWRAVAEAFEIHDRRPLMRLLEAKAYFRLAFGGRPYPLAHPSPSVINTTRSLEQQCAEWRRLRPWLNGSWREWP